MVNILLVENQPIFAGGLALILQSIPQQKIVDVVYNADNMENLCIKHRPDVVFIRDFIMYRNNGFSVTEQIKKSFPEIKVIMILMAPKNALINEAQKHGVDSCVLATDPPSAFHECLWATMRGEHIYPVVNDNVWGADRVVLSEKELDIIRLTCQNLSYDEVAERLGLTRRTISYHISNIMHKTGHKNIAGIVLEAVHKGFLTNWYGDK